jgi:hypothetical protein
MRPATSISEFPAELKETGYKLEFRELFIWRAPSVKIGVELRAERLRRKIRVRPNGPIFRC